MAITLGAEAKANSNLGTNYPKPLIISLDATHIAVAYYTSSGVYTIVGSISGTTVTFGAEQQVNSSTAITSFDICKLTSTSYVVATADTSVGNAYICSVSSGTTVSVGTGQQYVNYSIYSMSMCSMTSSSFVVSWSRSSTFFGQTIAGTVSAGTITYGTIVAFDGTNAVSDTGLSDTPRGTITKSLDATNFVIIFFARAGGAVKSSLCTLSTRDITAGTVNSLDPDLSDFAYGATDVAVLSSTTFMVLCNGKASIGTVSGGAVSMGAFATVTNSSASGGAVMIDAGRVAVTYRVSTNAVRCRVLTFSGTTISNSTEGVLDSSNANYNFSSVCKLDTNIFVGCWNDAPGSNNYVGVIYGSEITVLGPVNMKSYNTNLKANIKSINTNLIANVKSLNTNV